MTYLFLANGFEEMEALVPYDCLLRAGVDVKTVSVSGDPNVRGTHGVVVRADMTVDQIKKGMPDCVILPGGMPGAQNLFDSPVVRSVVSEAAAAGAVVGAICAAPFVLGRLGLLNGKKATCFPGFEGELEGAVYTGERVVRDGNIITGRGAGVAPLFAKALIEALCGKETADRVFEQMMA